MQTAGSAPKGAQMQQISVPRVQQVPQQVMSPRGDPTQGPCVSRTGTLSPSLMSHTVLDSVINISFERSVVLIKELCATGDLEITVRAAFSISLSPS